MQYLFYLFSLQLLLERRDVRNIVVRKRDVLANNSLDIRIFNVEAFWIVVKEINDASLVCNSPIMCVGKNVLHKMEPVL